MCEKEEQKRGPYKPRTDKQLKQIATDWVTNRIFTSDQVRGKIELQLVFMPLVFLDQEGLDWMRENKISLLYADVSKALPRSINGAPMFMEILFLNEDDHKKMVELAQKIDQAIAEVDPDMGPKG